jgi:hypothetical protein
VQKNIMRLTDDEIKAAMKGRIKDKLLDLEVEAAQLEQPEGPENPSAPDIDLGAGSLGGLGGLGGGPATDTPPAAPEPAMPELDLGAGLSEKNRLSIKDEFAPIRISNRINTILTEVEEKGENNNVTELEKFQQEKQKLNKKKQEKRRKYARKKHLFADNPSSEYQRTRTRETDPFYDVKHELKSDAKYKPENIMPENNDLNIDEYLENNIIKNAEYSARIKSTINSLNEKFKITNTSEDIDD